MQVGGDEAGETGANKLNTGTGTREGSGTGPAKPAPTAKVTRTKANSYPSRSSSAAKGSKEGPAPKSSKGPPSKTESKARGGGRRRAIIHDYSEDEDGDGVSHQVNQPPPPLIKGKALPLHDSDIDMQLVDVSPEHGGSSLKLSLSNEDFTAGPNQAAVLRIDTINLGDRTPHTRRTKAQGR